MGGAEVNVWHDRVGLSPQADEDVEGIKEAVKVVEAEVEELEKLGIPSKYIFVFGFSMGGHVALQFFLQSAVSKRIGGVAAMSCFLAENSLAWRFIEEDRSVNTKICGTNSQSVDSSYPKLFQLHGEADEMVKEAWGYQTSTRLRENGIVHEYKSYPSLGHGLRHDAMRDIEQWMLVEEEVKSE
mgnify:CR=1 FL=1|tara:strand:- start:114 stop:665 length:552 start_codon:yes stop_codon:yes gene_type:complete